MRPFSVLHKQNHALERNRMRHKIVDEAEQEDGSVVIRIIKQYNRSLVGDYLD